MRIRIAIPEVAIRADVFDAGLETTTRINEALMRSGRAPTFSEMLDRGVEWRPEPPGDEHFDHAAIVAARGHGDCDDLSPARAAELRITGEDPGARAIAVPSGPRKWHAIVRRSDGSTEDPSVAAGMGRISGVDDDGVAPAFMPLMRPSVADPAVSVRPGYGQWVARVDVPWWQRALSNTNYAISALAQAPTQREALRYAVDGACFMCDAAGVGHPRAHAQLAGLQAVMGGTPRRDIARILEDAGIPFRVPLWV